MRLVAFIIIIISGCVPLSAQSLYQDSLLLKPIDSTRFSQNSWYWTKVKVDRMTAYIELANWGHVIAYADGQITKTGSQIKGKDKTYFSYRNIIPTAEGSLLVKLKGDHPLFELASASITTYTEEGWRYQERSRLIAHGLFFGILIVMALYNLMIYFAVKDQSYLWYVLAIVGFGLYMAFYYGFTFEHFWPSMPHWNAFFFALIIPLTNISRIQFTRTYLHTGEYVPEWDLFFKGLLGLYLIPIFMWFCSWLEIADWLIETNYVIGFLGSINMTAITIVSFIVLRRNYKPALWFLLAFSLFNVGAILFIFRELDYLRDNFLTQYIIQIGAVAQVVLFSLGLSDRLNRTRKMLATQTIEKEKLAKEREMERKLMVEKQKIELENQVKQRTLELEQALEQIKVSESELRALNKVKTKLFSIISHELKSPLSTVDSYLNLFIKHYNKLTQEEIAELSEKTRLSLHNLILLMDNLLTWSRLQQEDIQFNPVEIDLRKVVDKSIKLFALLIEQKKLRINISSEIDEVMLCADKDMSEFIVRNLLHNAIKFTPIDGEITISSKELDGKTQVCILDSGIGMPAEMIDKILNQEERISRNGTEREKGSGMGLLMCKDFVERNGGSLEINSSPSSTEVSFILPSYIPH